MSIETVKEQAERARAEADRQYKTSEYPGYGRSCHQRVASSLDDLADTLSEIGEEPPADTGSAFADRKARRVYWLRRKAAEKHVTSARSAAHSHDMGSSRPMGQPFQGSPARRRAQANAMDRERRADDRSHHEYEEAKELEHRADAAERNKSIYRQDPDSLVKLRGKLAGLESRRNGIKAAKPKAPPILNYRSETVRVRNSYHKGQIDEYPQIELSKAEWKRRPGDYKSMRIAESGAHRVRTTMVQGHALAAVFLTDSKVHEKPGPDEKLPEGCDGTRQPGWVLSNLGANIRRVKQQIEEHEADDAREERPGRHIGDVEVRDNLEHMKVELWFPSKPDEATRTLIKRHGFRWIRSVGCWSRGINSQTEYGLTELAKHLGHDLEEVAS